MLLLTLAETISVPLTFVRPVGTLAVERRTVPASLPSSWRFEAPVDQGEVPVARSPYVKNDAEAWQALLPGQWRPGGAVKCLVTQREFLLPQELPRLTVVPGEKPPSVRSGCSSP